MSALSFANLISDLRGISILGFGICIASTPDPTSHHLIPRVYPFGTKHSSYYGNGVAARLMTKRRSRRVRSSERTNSKTMRAANRGMYLRRMEGDSVKDHQSSSSPCSQREKGEKER